MRKILTVVAVLLAIVGSLLAFGIFRRYSNNNAEAENDQ